MFLPHTPQRVWQELQYIVSMCAVSPVVHTSNISSCQKKKKLFQFSCDCEKFLKVRSFGFLVINVCNRGEHYETHCTVHHKIEFKGYSEGVEFPLFTSIHPPTIHSVSQSFSGSLQHSLKSAFLNISAKKS